MATVKSVGIVGPDISTDALYKLWCKWVYDSLIAIGFTEVAETGRTDWTGAITKPAAGALTKAHWNVFRFNDALQATKPIFFRIDFGTGHTATTSPGMWITTGESTNGSGVIGGASVMAAAQLLGSYQQGSATPSACRAVGNAAEGWFGISMWGTHSVYNPAFAFGVERSRDSVGDSTGTYCFTTCIPSYAIGATGYGGIFAGEIGVGVAAKATHQTLVGGSDGNLWQPGLLWANDGIWVGPMMTFMCYPVSNGSGGTSFSFNHYGSVRKYVALSYPTNYATYNFHNNYTDGTIAFAMAWPD